MTTSERARWEPLLELGTIRELGAEVIAYEVAGDDAAASARVRDLGLPRDAVVNVIVRDGDAIPPRGSTGLRPGDRLHILVRRESARELDELTKRWRSGPVGPPPRPRRRLRAHAPIFSVSPGDGGSVSGDPARPQAVHGEPVVALLRNRRDVPGALVALADGRYAVTGPLLMVGGPSDLARYAHRRLRTAEPDERAWLQNVIGALAVDSRG